MAIVFEDGGKRLEFSVLGYQFQERINDCYDDNWLKIEIDYSQISSRAQTTNNSQGANNQSSNSKTNSGAQSANNSQGANNKTNNNPSANNTQLERHAKYTDYCVMVQELSGVSKAIDELLNGTKSAFSSRFMEPFLQFVIKKSGDKFVVQVSYVYDSSTPDWKELYVAQVMDGAALQKVNDGLKEYLTQFPYRAPIENKPTATANADGDKIKFCSVEFGGGKTYYYTTDDDSIAVGDFVKVPAGVTDDVCVVEVVAVEYFARTKTPMPLDKVKKIICKVY
jgi:hypothetical protein